MTTWAQLGWLALAGALGTLARYGASELANRLAGGHYPLGTFTVNVLGSFLFGFIWHLAAVRLLIPDQLRIILLVGFMGSFTTFSSLMFDSFALGQTRARSHPDAAASPRPEPHLRLLSIGRILKFHHLIRAFRNGRACQTL